MKDDPTYTKDEINALVNHHRTYNTAPADPMSSEQRMCECCGRPVATTYEHRSWRGYECSLHPPTPATPPTDEARAEAQTCTSCGHSVWSHADGVCATRVLMKAVPYDSVWANCSCAAAREKENV